MKKRPYSHSVHRTGCLRREVTAVVHRQELKVRFLLGSVLRHGGEKKVTHYVRVSRFKLHRLSRKYQEQSLTVTLLSGWVFFSFREQYCMTVTLT